MRGVLAYRATWLDPYAATAVVTVVAYAVVAATFAGVLPIYPDLSRGTIDAISHATAAINATTVALLVLGWYSVRRGHVRRHAAAMLGAVATIAAFLVLYLTRIGGGGQKEIVGAEGLALAAYLGMLGVHVVLSILAVPLVVFVLAMAVSRPVEELYGSRHPRVGRVTVATWLVSLVLGVLAYVLLNHVYAARLAA